MNRYYLVDDDLAVVNVLKLIIEHNGRGIVCGHAQNGADALDDLPHARPDIVLVDMLMPEMDGITFVQKAKEAHPHLHFIMLSQVSAKNLIAKAYESGIEFFIQKPVNSVEVLNVLAHMDRYTRMQGTYQQMQALFGTMEALQPPVPAAGEGAAPPAAQPQADPAQTRVMAVLHKLGIGGDVAGRDLCRAACYIMENQSETSRMNVGELCRRLDDSPKAMEQRMRRAVAAGMANLASLGLEDYAGDIFTNYAGVLYRFEQVRREMDFIRGKSASHGKASLRTFLFTLADICRV